MPAPSSTAKNAHYAKFATTSRLIASLTTEALVGAFYVPAKSSMSEVTGLCMLLRSTCDPKVCPSSVELSDILALVPLKGVPILAADKKQFASLNGITCPRIELVDGWDMLPHIYSILETDDANETSVLPPLPEAQLVRAATQETLSLVCRGVKLHQLRDGFDAVQLWNQFAADYGVNHKLSEQIAQELGSSMLHQAHTYDHPKPLPTLASSTIHWEQVILEGHATHPMHKARKSFPPMPPLNPEHVNLEQPKLRLVAVPRTSMKVRGDFDALSAPLVDIMLGKGNDQVTGQLRRQYADHVLIPIHELQVPNIQQKFPDAVVLSSQHEVPVYSLTSIRSVAEPDILPGLSVKLCLGIKVSSALRTITPFTTHFGPGFSRDVVPKLNYNHKVLTVERELASACYVHEDFDVAKHCSCVLREAVEYAKDNNDTIVPCAALVEKIQKPDTDETLVTHVWGLDTEEKRIAFLDRYIKIALEAFLPPALNNGVAFEAHGQNTLARFDRETGELKGFVIRDFGGIKVHRETLRKTTGTDIDVIPDSCVVAETLEEVYKLIYHTLIHSQLQRLIRVLDLHYNGKGWELLRTHMAAMVPKDHPMWAVFMDSTKVPGKCMVRMKIEELYRDYIYSPVPNVIHYRPQSVEDFA
ncbi:IucC family-domain-containing protein [Radiomyces spectabilis]|uniref:IucC family-domain-containing protein n=1 Tax=Radiomyces spectabilis TaxID=64574 RepID=UPI00221E775D|nr:IucC family-domain-containing protein [Radiomyces spectabilis]KAI8384841.1 IucC family-domain-containing protein [Radiomyces spectabilis]